MSYSAREEACCLQCRCGRLGRWLQSSRQAAAPSLQRWLWYVRSAESCVLQGLCLSVQSPAHDTRALSALANFAQCGHALVHFNFTSVLDRSVAHGCCTITSCHHDQQLPGISPHLASLPTRVAFIMSQGDSEPVLQSTSGLLQLPYIVLPLASLSCRMASCCWSLSHRSRARSRAAPGTLRASASSVAVPAASLCPLTRHSCACWSQHMPASASSPASTASCLLTARIGSCTQRISAIYRPNRRMNLVKPHPAAADVAWVVLQ